VTYRVLQALAFPPNFHCLATFRLTLFDVCLRIPDSKFKKRSQLFIRTHNETLSVAAVRVSNEDWL
jgi:hypothetical protein